jgi:hypothetical protein
MVYERLVIGCVLSAFLAQPLFPAECGSAPTREMNLDSGSEKSLLSPDRQWKLISFGPNSDDKAVLYIQSASNSKKWTIGRIERAGKAFWSDDSKRLFLRDDYAADDTRIRVFDLTGPIPKEIKGLNGRIQHAISLNIPPNKETQWVYFPEVCFAANDSSRIVLVADAPLVLKKESSSGTPFSVKVTVNLIALEIASTTEVPSAKNPE